jgi:hypothetical protein
MSESRKQKLERARTVFNEDFIDSFSDGLTKIIDPASGEHFSKEEARSLIISLVGAVVDGVEGEGLDDIVDKKMCEFGLVEETGSPAVVRVATTSQFYALAEDSNGRNRGPNSELLAELDLNGVHVLAFQMLHNEIEWRGQWLCKVNGRAEAIHIWMDNSPEAYESYTTLETVGA